MSAKRRNLLIETLIFSITVILLLLSIGNLNSLGPKMVLGIQNENVESPDLEYWQNFLKENPDYIPGWIELNNSEKAREIDPNFIWQPLP